jgi:hypothetical protein
VPRVDCAAALSAYFQAERPPGAVGEYIAHCAKGLLLVTG